MTPVYFSKFEATGNDFILIDDRKRSPVERQTFYHQERVANWCHRRTGIGADGLILLCDGKQNDGTDFEMVNFNSDGSPSSMCGNGARALIAFALELSISKIHSEHFQFLAPDGLHRGKSLNPSGWVEVSMQDVTQFRQTTLGFWANTGSPHLVRWIDSASELEKLDLATAGPFFRHHSDFAPAGTNVNFALLHGNEMRTFERGVEGETFSCGTGAIAVAIAKHCNAPSKNTTVTESLQTRGGPLEVSFRMQTRMQMQSPKQDSIQFDQIILSGPVSKVFTGTISG